MAKRKKFKSEQEAIAKINRAMSNIAILKERIGKDLYEPSGFYAAASPIIKNFYDLCEGCLYLVCCSKADPNGTEEFPTMNDLKSEYSLVDITPEPLSAANVIVDINKRAQNDDITMIDFDNFLLSMEVFLTWIEDSLGASEISRLLHRLIDEIHEWARDCHEMRRIYGNFKGYHPLKTDYPDSTMGMIFYRNVDQSKMTEEELDELYRPRKTNSRKDLATLYIYLILKERTDREHRLLINDLVRILKQEYEIGMGRKAISSKVENLAQEDLNICKELNGGGVWYEEINVEDYNDIDDYF